MASRNWRPCGRQANRFASGRPVPPADRKVIRSPCWRLKRCRTVRYACWATDIANNATARAQAGTYTQHEVQRGVPARRLLMHFDQIEIGWRIRPALRAMCQFGIGNLLNEPAPLGLFDVIFCRNVLTHFDEPTKRLVLAALTRQLAPAGWLYLGASETADAVQHGCRQAEPGWPIYCRAD